MDCLLVLLMSLDALLACLALGAQGIRVEKCSRVVIAGVGAGCLALSFLCFIPAAACRPFPLHKLRGIACDCAIMFV